jgi:hypothetical protein
MVSLSSTPPDWPSFTDEQTQIIDGSGLGLICFGGLMCVFASASFLHRAWRVFSAAPEGGDAVFGQASPPKERQAAISLIIKGLLAPSLLFRVMSIAAIVFGFVPLMQRCTDFPSSCNLIFFSMQIFLAIPSFCLNSLFILLSLFWPWLLSLTTRTERPFAHLLLDWAMLCAVMWIAVVLLFIAAALTDLEMIYAGISYFSNAVVLLNILVFSYFGVRLILRIRKFGDSGVRFTRKLFFITFLVLFFAAIRVIFTILLNSSLYHPNESTSTFIWIMSYFGWCFFCEFLPELALLFLVANPSSLLRSCTCVGHCCASSSKAGYDQINS